LEYIIKLKTIYISSGTSLVLPLLTLLDLEKDRQIEYVNQKKLKDSAELPEIKAIKISKDNALLFLKTLTLK